MASDGKSKYQRAVERSRARGFDSPYAERKARAQAKGYSSPRAERNERERARGKVRDYAAERQAAARRAQAEGFINAYDRRKFKRDYPNSDNKLVEAFQKRRVLEHFGISESKLNKVRAENRAYNYPGARYSVINTYDLDRDKDVHNWSINRIGYILAFHAAIVNPKSNYDSLQLQGKRIIDGKRPKTNVSQYYYLVKYTGIMSVSEFEARYGKTVVTQAELGEVKP